MNRDKKIVYASSALLVLALVGALFLPHNGGRAITALILAAFAIVIFFLIKKRPVLSIDKNQVLLLMSTMGAVCLVLYYLTGIHFGFYRSGTPLSIGSFFSNILPIAVIIIAIEVIRYIILAQKAKFIGVFVYIGGVLTEVLVFATLDYITNFNRFMDAVGLVFLPAIVTNLLYNYISKHYGFLPNIAYRLIMSLYAYILPVYPRTPDVLFAFAKILAPVLIYAFIKSLYAKKHKTESYKKKAAGYVSVGILVAIMISIVMLISCKFQYGMLVIATDSMTGEINKGDAVVYEEYDEQTITEGQVILFRKDSRLIVHRVSEIQRINGRNRYYTKGDANDSVDTGYISDGDIEGVVLFKVAYIGYPSIWVRDLFK